MAVIEINKNPSKRELRQFAAMFLVFFGIIGGVVWKKTGSFDISIWIWSAAAIVSIGGFFLTGLLRYVYLGMIYLAFPIGWVVSHVVLGLVLWGLLTPIGLVMKLIGHDPMKRKIEKDRASYWEPHEAPENVERYFRQF